jgi:Zn-dependent M28 family amino/carboxypeptidase
MGTVAVMGAARALAEKPAERPVIFLAVTGEEKGLLGSKYFAEKPLVPLRHIIFNLNNDGGGMADKDIVNVLGLHRTGISELVILACEEFGLTVNSDETFEFLFNASDNISFVSKGIPAMTYSPGFRVFNQETPAHYHRPSDEPETIDYDYYVKFVRAYAKTARNIANASARPQWVSGDRYEEAGKKLYNLQY